MVKGLISLLLTFSLPGLPTAITNALTASITYLTEGINILRFFIGNEAMTVVSACLGVIISVNTLMKSWQFIWWILGKFPFLNLDG